MSDNGLVWEEPPKTHDRRGRWITVLMALQERPGEWAVIHERTADESETQAKNKRYNIETTAARLGLKVETTVRTVDGHVKVYGRVP